MFCRKLRLPCFQVSLILAVFQRAGVSMCVDLTGGYIQQHYLSRHGPRASDAEARHHGLAGLSQETRRALWCRFGGRERGR
jgi:hypothetical protein